jgi:signal transduction histidine kinase
VYFSVLETLQNASKHADGAKRITISLNEDERLRFEVRDDGVGFDASNGHGGAGLANIRDRLAAVGGQLELDSSAGRGTVVLGRVPLT